MRGVFEAVLNFVGLVNRRWYYAIIDYFRSKCMMIHGPVTIVTISSSNLLGPLLSQWRKYECLLADNMIIIVRLRIFMKIHILINISTLDLRELFILYYIIIRISQDKIKKKKMIDRSYYINISYKNICFTL